MNMAELSRLDIRAWADAEGKLILDAPAGALTPEMLVELRQSKAVLLAELARNVNVVNMVNIVSSCTHAGEKTIPIRHEVGAMAEGGTGDTATVAEVIGQCQPDAAARDHFIGRAADNLQKNLSDTAFDDAIKRAEAIVERAAIIEFDSGTGRVEAERLALIDDQGRELESLLAIVAPAYRATPAEIEEMKDCARSDLENALVCYSGLANQVLA